jgi:hypothetical protein
MNRHIIVQGGWSDDDSRRGHESRWTDEPHFLRRYEDGGQCGRRHRGG